MNINPLVVKNTLQDIISQMSHNLSSFVNHPDKDFSRNRKLGFEKMMNLFISRGSGALNHELLKFFDFETSLPTSSAFYQQRSKLNLNAFQHVLKEFNSRFHPNTHSFLGKYSLIACDGSEFNIFRNSDDPLTYNKPCGFSKKGWNMIHTISLYNLLNKRYLDLEVQPGKQKNEYRALCNLLDRYSYGGSPIIIADRGFASYNVFAHAIENNIQFMIRAQDNNVKGYLKVDSLPDEMDITVDFILSRTKSKKKWKQPEKASQYRYIYANVPFDFIDKNDKTDEYPITLRIVRFLLDNGTCETIITNLPTDEFPPLVLKDCYHLRWGIETSFLELKHTIGAGNFHSKSYQFIEMELWSRLIAFNYCSTIIMHVPIHTKNRIHEYQVNFSMAMKICLEFLRMPFDKKRDIVTLIQKYILPIRNDRHFERRPRLQPKASFVYRNF